MTVNKGGAKVTSYSDGTFHAEKTYSNGTSETTYSDGSILVKSVSSNGTEETRVISSDGKVTTVFKQKFANNSTSIVTIDPNGLTTNTTSSIAADGT